jgi:very-long-chain enoyl-CoA reductase
MKIKICAKDGTLLREIDVAGNSLTLTAEDIAKEWNRLNPKYSLSRQRFYNKKDGKLMCMEESLSSYDLNEGDSVIFKDLGRQISWKTVFLVEYIGPLIIHPLFFFTSESISSHQKVLFLMIMFHYIKREMETLFIHRFSHSTMPFKNIFKNSFHYWILSGIMLAYDIYQPTNNEKLFSTVDYIFVVFWIFSEISNLSTHLTLRNLRPEGTKVRRIPYGYGFDKPLSISCPNYFFEMTGWISFTLLSQSFAALFFTIVSIVQLYIWAIKKHKQYKREFPKYPNRYPMIPLVK